jgi:hypothetical protein
MPKVARSFAHCRIQELSRAITSRKSSTSEQSPTSRRNGCPVDPTSIKDHVNEEEKRDGMFAKAKESAMETISALMLASVLASPALLHAQGVPTAT